MKTTSRLHARSPVTSGFTLLEVLVALLIVGTALGASLRAIGSLTKNSEGLRSAMMATWSAENRLMQIRLSAQWPEIGNRSFACPQAEFPLLCNEHVLATLNPYFRRVEVNVVDSRTPQQQIIKMVQVVAHGS